MIFLHVFTEEPSLKIVLENLLPSMLTENISFKIYPHQGKQDLEKAIRRAIPSISRIPGSRIIITRDQDSSNCVELKQNLDEIAHNNCFCPYKIRIVCQELESWFLGDLEAIEGAFHRFKGENHIGKAEFRNVDAISKPSEYLLKILPEYSGIGYLPKMEVAEKVSKNMGIDRNRSTSFNHFIRSVRDLTSGALG
ncbi:MAG: DUF4276 family protein [Cyclobacteriaceae bacterium]|nr:DUF4276 family protein [Cyclobacteriaceae bacterium]